ncbi:MAG: LCP family protein [Lachnospiraceae bacterium]|nr:LCP family protein [Lachnospiraceae bacterium]
MASEENRTEKNENSGIVCLIPETVLTDLTEMPDLKKTAPDLSRLAASGENGQADKNAPFFVPAEAASSIPDLSAERDLSRAEALSDGPGSAGEGPETEEQPAGFFARHKKKILIPVGILGGLIAVVLLVGVIAFYYFYGLTNYDDNRSDISYASSVEEETLNSSDEAAVIDNMTRTAETSDAPGTETEEAEGSSDKEREDQEESSSGRTSRESSEESASEGSSETDEEEAETAETETESTLPSETRPTDPDKDMYYLLLIGVDAHDETWYGNSDSMIMVSVNYNTRKICLTSLMRDTAVNVPGIGIRKLNAAYANGGAPLLIQTIQENFGIRTDNYAMVSFEALKAVINAIGGIDMYLTHAETEWLRNKRPPEEVGYGDAVVHLNGRAALWHARNRSEYDADFGRTRRQRDVLMTMVEKVKKGGAASLTRVANTVLPYITHDLSRGKVVDLMLQLPDLLKFEFSQMRIPYDGLYTISNEFLIPDYAVTTQKYYETVLQ